ncbi:hypothetical protein V9T40_000953 [Parthenolecanium corni]|uniref:Cx9C motif-containing protein 4 n=1 Tax=Parthenolecanium corni TaxID=536013 RepID=A0AAN9TC25_9HEMI
MSPPDNPCKKYACMIQKCLKENNFRDDKCLHFIELLENCCAEQTERTVSCPDINPSKRQKPVHRDIMVKRYDSPKRRAKLLKEMPFYYRFLFLNPKRTFIFAMVLPALYLFGPVTYRFFFPPASGRTLAFDPRREENLSKLRQKFMERETSLNDFSKDTSQNDTVNGRNMVQYVARSTSDVLDKLRLEQLQTPAHTVCINGIHEETSTKENTTKTFLKMRKTVCTRGTQTDYRDSETQTDIRIPLCTFVDGDISDIFCSVPGK